jgi:hypothetical protein
MIALTVTTEDTLLIRAREPHTMVKDPTCGTGTREVLTRGYVRLLRRLHERGVSFYATGGR